MIIGCAVLSHLRGSFLIFDHSIFFWVALPNFFFDELPAKTTDLTSGRIRSRVGITVESYRFYFGVLTRQKFTGCRWGAFDPGFNTPTCYFPPLIIPHVSRKLDEDGTRFSSEVAASIAAARNVSCVDRPASPPPPVVRPRYVVDHRRLRGRRPGLIGGLERR